MPMCVCADFHDGHHPECPVLREIERLTSDLMNKNRMLDVANEHNQKLEKVLDAAKFAQAVLWGSDGDKKGAIKYLDKAIAEVSDGR